MMERAGAIVDLALAGEAMAEVYAAFARLAVGVTGGDAAWVLLECQDERFVASHVRGHDDELGGGARPVPGFLRGAELETRLARRPIARTADGATPYATVPVRLGPSTSAASCWPTARARHTKPTCRRWAGWPPSSPWRTAAGTCTANAGRRMTRRCGH